MCLFITTHIYKRTGAGPTGRKKGCGWAMPCTSGTPGREWVESLIPHRGFPPHPSVFALPPGWNVPSRLRCAPHHSGVPALQVQHWRVHHRLSHRPPQGLAGGDADRRRWPALQHPCQSVWGDESVRHSWTAWCRGSVLGTAGPLEWPLRTLGPCEPSWTGMFWRLAFDNQN